MIWQGIVWQILWTESLDVLGSTGEVIEDVRRLVAELTMAN